MDSLDTRNLASVCRAFCTVCGQPYFRTNSLTQVVCSLKCARRVPIIAKNTLKAEKKADRAKLKKLEPLSKAADRAQTEVNRYARLRDYKYGCISCELPPTWSGQWHGSHMRSRGAASAVRFNLWNINKACGSCNRFQGGNIAVYEPRLRARIGNERVDWLYTQNQITRYSPEYLERLRRVFAKKSRRMEKRIEMQN